MKTGRGPLERLLKHYMEHKNDWNKIKITQEKPYDRQKRCASIPM